MFFVAKNKIQSLPESQYETMALSLGLKAGTNEQITFSSIIESLIADIKVYLEDR